MRKIVFTLFSSVIGNIRLFNKEQSATCSKFNLIYDPADPPTITDFDEFFTPWFDATFGGTPEVSSIFLHASTYDNTCNGIRSLSRFDISALFDRAVERAPEVPTWIGIRCKTDDCKKFQVRYCCNAIRNIVSDTNEILDPRWNTGVTATCNPTSELPSLNDEYRTQWYPSPAVDGQPNPGAILTTTAENVCQTELSNTRVSARKFENILKKENRKSQSSGNITLNSDTSVRCSLRNTDGTCKEFMTQFCCPVKVPTTTTSTTTTTTTIAATTTTTTTTAEPTSECLKDGIHADPEDCSSFYFCVHGERRPNQPCGAGLLFHPVHLVCDWPANVKHLCGPTTTVTTASPTECLKDGIHADPEDCTSFYFCVHGERKNNQSCAQGLLFHPVHLICDWAFNVQHLCGTSHDIITTSSPIQPPLSPVSQTLSVSLSISVVTKISFNADLVDTNSGYYQQHAAAVLSLFNGQLSAAARSVRMSISTKIVVFRSFGRDGAAVADLKIVMEKVVPIETESNLKNVVTNAVETASVTAIGNSDGELIDRTVSPVIESEIEVVEISIPSEGPVYHLYQLHGELSDVLKNYYSNWPGWSRRISVVILDRVTKMETDFAKQAEICDFSKDDQEFDTDRYGFLFVPAFVIKFYLGSTGMRAPKWNR